MKRIAPICIALLFVLTALVAPSVSAKSINSPKQQLCPPVTSSLSNIAQTCDPGPTPTEPTPTEPVPTEPPPVVTPNPEVTHAPIVVEHHDTVNYDGQVSFNDSDLGVALFKNTDAAGQPELDVYNLKNQGSEGSYMFSITQEDLALFATPPAHNTLLRAMGQVSVYILTTGEIQINAGPDSEGKVHVKIFDGIPWTHVYGYTIDPVK